MAKVQGEGDYESARRYNSRTRRFVQEKGTAATKRPAGGVDKAALSKARSKARDGGQDQRDARVFTKLESAARKKTATRRKAH
jgi:hypothetical protein